MNSQKNQKLLAGLLMILFFTLLYFIFLYKSSVESPQLSSQDVLLNSSDKNPLQTLPQNESLSNQETPAPLAAEKSDFIQNELNNCFPHLAQKQQDLKSLETLYQFIQSHDGKILSQKLEVENFNYLDEDGKEYRVQILPSDNTQGEKTELRFFSLDSEGYPHREPPPPHLDINKRLSYLAQKKILLHQKKINLQFENGNSLFLETINNQVHDLLWRTAHGTFACSKQTCRCFGTSPNDD